MTVDTNSVLCAGEHHYFVAETGTVENEGKVCVVVVCTACGEGKLLEFFVSNSKTPIALRKGNS